MNRTTKYVLTLGYLVLLGVSSMAKADVEYGLIDDSYLEVRRYWHFYNPFFDEVEEQTGEQWTGGLALGLDLYLIKGDVGSLRFNNRVEGDTTDKQFRRVSWEYDLFYSYRDRLDFGWDHESQHVMDVESSGFYPLKDTFYIRMHFKSK